MSKKVLGIIIVILSAIAMVINISFFKEMEWYNTVRWISLFVFIIGFFMFPNYSKPKSNN